MKNHLPLPLLLIITLSWCAFAQDIDSSGMWKMLPDSSQATSPVADTSLHQAKTGMPHDSAAVSIADTTAKKADATTFKLIKRNYNSRQQVLLASGMMAFVIIMMTMAQQFNPE